MEAMNDIDFAVKVAEEIEAIRPGLVKKFEQSGFTFTAGNST